MIINNIVNTTAGTGNSSGIAFLENGPAGRVCSPNGTTIERNTSTDNEGDGIFVASNSANNVLTRNIVERNGRSGTVLEGPEFRNTFTNVGPTVLDLVEPDRAPFVQGIDCRVMSGSGSGNVTGRLVAIDIKIGGTGSTTPTRSTPPPAAARRRTTPPPGSRPVTWLSSSGAPAPSCPRSTGPWPTAPARW